MKLILLPLLMASGALAGSFTVIDPFGQPVCPPGQIVGCDVVGQLAQFDFYRADFNFGASSATIQLYFNFNSATATSLAPFAATSLTTVSVADVFIYAGGQIYAIPLNNRTSATYGNATAGTLYLLNSPSAILTSSQLANPADSFVFRPNQPVWFNSNQASVASVGSISVSLNPTIDGNTTRFLVTVNLAYAPGSLLATNLNQPGVTAFTGTSTGANDLAGQIGSPEPSTWMMLSSGAGLALLSLRRRRQK